MQKYFMLALFAFSNLSFAATSLKLNCSNEDTYLKLNEVRVNENGQRVAELFMNFKELNRILNLPEVILRQSGEGFSVRESDGSSTVLLKFGQDDKTQQAEPDHEITIWIRLDGKKIRKNIKLICEK